MQSSHSGLRLPPPISRTGLLPRAGLLLLALALLVPSAATAQSGTISGIVTDAETGEPLADAAVEVLGAASVAGTNSEGRFQVQGIEPGSYSIVVTLIGYETTRLDGVGVNVDAGATVTIAMRSRALVLNPVVVTASRRQEKALDAPASITTVSAAEVARTTASTVADHVRALPGIDAAQTGISQGTVVTRGFNNVFSGSLLTIIDNRYARVPSLRFNAYSLFPTNDLDIDRIEVSLGPGAALYGPNASNGVMHIITPSPIDRPGSAVSLAGGERSLIHGQLRSAHRLSDNFGFKISGQYQRGNDWEYVDPVEIFARDYANERYSVDARMDFRFAEDGNFVLSGGTSNLVNSLEMTGIGAAQVKGWGYNYGQARLSKGRFFAQGFYNRTNSGQDDANCRGPDCNTFLLRTGDAVVDQSSTMALQFQYGFDAGSWQSFTYGVDWQRTEPKSGGTIFGRNEDDDIIAEVGAYLHSETSLGDRVDLVTAIRIDDHNRLSDPNISPRAALVFRPAEAQNFRLSFNRAFSTPTSTNLFLDIVAQRLTFGDIALGDVRALGVPAGGYTFSRGCEATGGLMGYCMRSVFAPGQVLPANAVALWPALLQLLPALDPALALIVPLLGDPGSFPGDPAVATIFQTLDLETAEFVPGGGPTNIGDLTSTIYNTFEVGYKGLLGDRVLLAADLYYSQVENFVGPLSPVTPTVFLEQSSVADFLRHRLAPLLQAGLLSDQVIVDIATNAAALPLGMVTPDQVDTPDIFLTYRNFGDVDYIGADLAAQVLVSDRFRLNFNYSFVSEECFDFNSDDSCASSQDIALNAPSHKGALGFTWDDQTSGFTAQARVRATDGFPMNSGSYIGTVDGYSVIDASLGYRIPALPSAQISLTANNLLNNVHREFVGAPEIGRLVMTRLRYDF